MKARIEEKLACNIIGCSLFAPGFITNTLTTFMLLLVQFIVGK
jgi:UPF0716 family protein affecting phage T7 exclusion